MRVGAMIGGSWSVQRLLSLLVWVGWIALFCAIVLIFEVATGYMSITGFTSNKAFIAFALIMVAALAIARPAIPFLVAVLFMPLTTMAFPGIAFIRGHMANMELVHPLIFCALLGWAIKRLHRQESFAAGCPLTVPVLIFLGWAGLSLNWCIDPRLAKWELIDIAFGIMIYVTALKVINSKKLLSRVVATWIFSGILMTGLGISFIARGVAARVDAMSGHPNIFSLELNLIIMLVVAMLYIGNQKFLPNWVLLPLLLIMLFVNLRTGSRAGFFSLMLALLFFLFSYHSKQKDTRHISLILSLAVLLFAVALFIFALNPLEGLRIGFRGYNPAEFAEEETFQYRIGLWVMAWEHIVTSGQYIQGLGPMSFLILYRREFGELGHPHSVYVNIGVHYGLVGLLIFTWMVVALVKQFYAGLRAVAEKYYQVLLRAMAAALLAFAIHGIVDFDIYYRRSIWLFVGVAMAAVNLAIKEGQEHAVDGDGDKYS